MANFYTENSGLKFQLSHPLMKKIVALKENDFADKDLYDYAPRDFEDAIDLVCFGRWISCFFIGG